MSLLQENSTTCFKRLLQESNSKKFHKSIEHVKKACDEIVNMKGLLNYSRVAQYTENHFGGPKRQSVMNNSKLRLYIDLRKQEYTNASQMTKQSTVTNKASEYPSDDLDQKTKSYIDQLRARNAFLEKAMNNLKQDILNETRANPIDLNKSITAGVQNDLSMQIVRESEPSQKSEQTAVFQKIFQRLLDIAKTHASPLDVKTREGKEYLAIDTTGYTATVLYNKELDMVRKILKE